MELLEEIGSPAEASPVVALLSDEDRSIVYAAARTLAAIGGAQEVVAMDVWLRGVSHRDDRQLRQHVQKCRDELKKRLDEAAPKTQANSWLPAEPSAPEAKPGSALAVITRCNGCAEWLRKLATI